mmetsp:Transcript_6698/g.23284  ORF Transcript_6698/g.23284 Transcript_6698/m.23284 type:complete len:265 (+) Transcript_6698:7572-8366(+)
MVGAMRGKGFNNDLFREGEFASHRVSWNSLPLAQLVVSVTHGLGALPLPNIDGRRADVIFDDTQPGSVIIHILPVETMITTSISSCWCHGAFRVGLPINTLCEHRPFNVEGESLTVKNLHLRLRTCNRHITGKVRQSCNIKRNINVPILATDHSAGSEIVIFFYQGIDEEDEASPDRGVFAIRTRPVLIVARPLVSTVRPVSAVSGPRVAKRGYWPVSKTHALLEVLHGLADRHIDVKMFLPRVYQIRIIQTTHTAELVEKHLI